MDKRILIVDFKRNLYFDSSYLPSSWHCDYNFECFVLKIMCHSNDFSSSIFYLFDLTNIVVYFNPSDKLLNFIFNNEDYVLINDEFIYF